MTEFSGCIFQLTSKNNYIFLLLPLPVNHTAVIVLQIGLIFWAYRRGRQARSKYLKCGQKTPASRGCAKRLDIHLWVFQVLQ